MVVFEDRAAIAGSSISETIYIRIAVPFSGRLRAPTPGLLDPRTSFEAASFQVNVRFTGSDSTSAETVGDETSHFRWVSHIELRLRETKPGGRLQEMVQREDKADVLLFLGPIVNRVLRAIRNGGLFSEAREIAFRPWQAESLLREWDCQFSADGEEWKLLYAPRSPLFDVLFSIAESGSSALNLELWSEIEESIQDDLQPDPEQEFVTNSFGHIHEYNFRLALVEAIVCLEIVLSQFLEQFLSVSKQLSQNRVDVILNPQVGLSARVAVLLDLVLSPEELKSVRIPEVLKAINWRNAIIHKTGHLPHGISDEDARECIFATLELALFLGRKRDEIAATPELRKLAQNIATKHEMPVPSIQPLRSHRVSVSFRGFMDSGVPSESKMLEVVGDLSDRLKERDKRFVPEAHLHVSFGALLGSARATWSKGRLEVVPVSFSFVRRPNES